MTNNIKHKLHLACGKIQLSGWINIDIDSDMADLQIDLTKGLPFEDFSSQYIYCEHFIEHVNREDALNILKECFRVLDYDGVLRLSTPDLTFLVIAYLCGNINEWGALWLPENVCHLMNEGMRSWGHQFLYNSDELSLILFEAGFIVKKFVPWGESQFIELQHLESRPFHGELIIEAYKSKQYVNNQQESTEHKSLAEFNLLGDVEKLKKSQNKLNDKRDYVKSLEHILLYQAHHNVNLDQTLNAQINHINSVKNELLGLNQNIFGPESITIDYLRSIQGLENELYICRKNISGLESKIIERSRYIQEIENEMVLRARYISELEHMKIIPFIFQKAGKLLNKFKMILSKLPLRNK